METQGALEPPVAMEPLDHLVRKVELERLGILDSQGELGPLEPPADLDQPVLQVVRDQLVVKEPLVPSVLEGLLA